MSDKIEAKRLRSFGLLVGGIFLGIGLWPLLWGAVEPRMWAVVVAGVLVLPALVWPPLLYPLFRVWMAVGHVMGWVNTRVILGLVFFLMVTPIGLVMRLLGKDPMTRGFEPDKDSYRIERSPRPAEHMERQF